MHEDVILIPKARIAVLIGEKGSSKRMLQREGKCRLSIDSQSGEVTVKAEDPVDFLKACDVVKAVARGFPPEISRKLFNDNCRYDVIDLNEYTSSKQDMSRMRSRVIGTAGSAKKHIELLTGTDIRIQGKTIAILGEPSRVEVARGAIERLLLGSPHQRAYNLVKERMENDSNR